MTRINAPLDDDSLPAGTLVAVDMQIAFRDSDSEWAVPRYLEAEANVLRLREAFNEVVWTKFVRAPEEAGSWEHYYDRWSTFRVDETDPRWELTVEPGPQDTVITLPTFSKWGTELAALAPIEQPLYACGVATDCCVLSTVLGAVDAGRKVVVIADACGAVSDEAQEQTLSVLGLLAPMVEIVQTRDVLGS
ncbi:cysteine hydrolase family protein [Corynebacterium lubricantis]|uniref:cysteine hydrolase family protein n=1 Tax=Corynebacterium lubricantis TaxID=541095 RepID=UPI0003603BD7|nr:cysteine hydrolase [Corynebacterium lubricantis]